MRADKGIMKGTMRHRARGGRGDSPRGIRKKEGFLNETK